jgi:hypothetical protein
VLEDFPDFAHHLADDPCIVENPSFRRAIVQIAKGLPLTDEQRQVAARMLQPASKSCNDTLSEVEPVTDSSQEGENTIDLEESYTQSLERHLKRQKTIVSEEEEATYWNLDLIPVTSVNCERHFSVAKHILTDTRKQTMPAIIDSLLMLKVNRKWWDEYSVGVAMGQMGNDVGLEEENSDELRMKGHFKLTDHAKERVLLARILVEKSQLQYWC